MILEYLEKIHPQPRFDRFIWKWRKTVFVFEYYDATVHGICCCKAKTQIEAVAETTLQLYYLINIATGRDSNGMLTTKKN
jgi:hypothetical protein